MIHHIRFCHPIAGKHEWHSGEGRVATIMDDHFVILKATKAARLERVVPMSNIAYIEQDVPPKKRTKKPSASSP